MEQTDFPGSPLYSMGSQGDAGAELQAARHMGHRLTGRGRTIIEVNRPDRSTRRRLGKSDPVDVEMAARSVLAGVARDYPKSGLDRVEMIRMLKIIKDSAIKARTQAVNQMKALIVTAPSELRHQLVGLDVPRL